MKLFLRVLPWFLAISPAFACQPGLAVRDAVYDYKIDHVETMLEEHQQAFLGGELSADALRCAFRPFAALRPETAEFVGHWRDRHPGSTSAKLAQSIVLHRFSQEMRGDRPATRTYIGALMEAKAMREEAEDLNADVLTQRPGLANVLPVEAMQPLEGLPEGNERFDRAEAALVHGPVDPNLIKMLQEGVATGDVTATPDDMLSFAERLLTASPYEPDHWAFYAWARSNVRQMSYAEQEVVRVNQVVFGNHSARVLLRYLSEKALTHDAVKQAQAGKFEGALADWLLEIDVEDDLTCPFVRAFRMHQRVCSVAMDQHCVLSSDEATRFRAIFDGSVQQGSCFNERNLPVTGLEFSPLPAPPFRY